MNVKDAQIHPNYEPGVDQITVNGHPYVSGTLSPAFPLLEGGLTTITVNVTAQAPISPIHISTPS